MAYFPTGAGLTEHDYYGFSAAEVERASSFHGLRSCLRSRLSRAIAPRTSALTVIGGDFNYVADPFDRMSTTSGLCTGRRDTSEERHFQNVISTPFGLTEMYQPEPTHASASSRARLDRV